MKKNILHALSEKSFLYLWLGEIFTQISIHLFNFFCIIIVFKETHSSTAVAVVVLAFTIPAILFGSFAGAYVDKWDKKKVLLITNLARALLFIILAFYIHNIYVLYTFGFIIAILTQFFIPAETPMVPLVVQKKNLLSANALFGMGVYGSILIAYALSGSLIIFLKPVNTLFFLAFMLIVGAAFIYFIKPRPSQRKDFLEIKSPSILKELKNTVSFMFKTKQISSSLLFLSLSQILILILATIAPGYASQVLHVGVEEVPLFFVTPAALGMIVGAVMLVNVFHNFKKEKVINVGLFLAGTAMLFLPYGSRVASRGFVQTINSYLPHLFQIDILHIMVVLAFILGFANALIFVPANTIIQERTKDEFRGKVYGFLNSFIAMLSILPIILVGGLSDLIGVGAVFTGIGATLLFFGILRLFNK